MGAEPSRRDLLGQIACAVAAVSCRIPQAALSPLPSYRKTFYPVGAPVSEYVELFECWWVFDGARPRMIKFSSVQDSTSWRT